MTVDVFICYAIEDKAAADATCATLENAGIRCWIAPRDILPGMDAGEATVDALERSGLMLMIFSSNSNSSLQIRREIQQAVHFSIPIVPLRIENIALGKSLEYFMGPIHWLDAVTPPFEEHLQRLPKVVSAFLSAGRPAREATQFTARPTNIGVARADYAGVSVGSSSKHQRGRTTFKPGYAITMIATIFMLSAAGIAAYQYIRRHSSQDNRVPVVAANGDVPTFDTRHTVFFRQPVVLNWSFKPRLHEDSLVYELESADNKEFAGSSKQVVDATIWYPSDVGYERWWRVRAKTDRGLSAPSNVIKTTYFSGSYDRIEKTGTLSVVVSSDISQGIFKFINNGVRDGVDIEVLKLVQLQLESELRKSIKINYFSMPWANLFTPLASGEADIAIAAITKLHSREERYGIRFSNRYYCTGKALLMRKDSIQGEAKKPSVKEIVHGRTVGVGIDTISSILLEKLRQELGPGYFSIIPGAQAEEMIKKMLEPSSNLNLVLTDSSFANARVVDNNDLLDVVEFSDADYPQTALPEEKRDEYGLAVNAYEIALLTSVNSALRKSEAAGELANIIHDAAVRRFPNVEERKLKPIYRSECPLAGD